MKNIQEISLMDQFEMDLENAIEIETEDSPWYVVVGGRAILIVMVA